MVTTSKINTSKQHHFQRENKNEMEDLVIIGQNDIYFTPHVKFNYATGNCTIEGESYHEEPKEFYDPLLDWLSNYMQEKKPIEFNFKYSYFNTGTSKCILEVLQLLKQYELDGGKVVVNWYYEEWDKDNQMEAYDFMVDSKIKMNIISVESLDHNL